MSYLTDILICTIGGFILYTLNKCLCYFRYNKGQLQPTQEELLFEHEKQMHIEMCLADECKNPRYTNYHFLPKVTFPFPACGGPFLCKTFQKPATVYKWEGAICKKAIQLHQQRRQLPSWLDAEGKCASILYRRTMNAMALRLCEKWTDKDVKTPTFQLQNGCCSSKDCPKNLFVLDILQALDDLLLVDALHDLDNKRQ